MFCIRYNRPLLKSNNQESTNTLPVTPFPDAPAFTYSLLPPISPAIVPQLLRINSFNISIILYITSSSAVSSTLHYCHHPPPAHIHFTHTNNRTHIICKWHQLTIKSKTRQQRKYSYSFKCTSNYIFLKYPSSLPPQNASSNPSQAITNEMKFSRRRQVTHY